MVVINGGPSPASISSLHQYDVIPSHSIGRDSTDLSAYALVTAYASVAPTPSDVPIALDRAITTAIVKQRPVYVEINLEIWKSPLRRAQWQPKLHIEPLAKWAAPFAESWATEARHLCRLDTASRASRGCVCLRERR